MTERSLFLLKPDGYDSIAVRKMLEAAIELNGLSILQRKIVNFKREDIPRLWPIFSAGLHPINAAIYVEYMTNGFCEAILVEGMLAIENSLEIKKQIRSRFETCAYENAVHCPGDAEEFLANYEILFGENSYIPSTKWPEWSKKGVFGRLSTISPAEAAQLASELWKIRQEKGWAGLFTSLEQSLDLGSQAILYPGDPNSIDYGLSVLAEALPNRSTWDVVRLYIQAEVHGSAVIANGDEPQLQLLQPVFDRHNMKLKVISRFDTEGSQNELWSERRANNEGSPE
ncbi:nucleoside diphosphate kinase [Paraburkholderia sp. GAS206C]|uniref:hypothetical protein n=1 Tax=unclassified Paraburkholderia TaxID=2615204 RepID=UPI003D24589D